ncbi:MAG: helix-turn-helix domain-containing protein [Hyalangium sp.]|uniref:helix-turn-helix domain-containing protein n=1 Tax=Hyalangium sp. TaxID=2028555 RepID=UPI003899B38F
MKPFEQQTYYELLEIPASAPETEIRAAYERAIETYSPDSVAVYTLVDPGQIDALRARLTEAMEILTDSDLRAEYDRMIGVNRAEAGVVVAMAPALAAAAQSVQPEASASTQARPVSPTPEAPAPSSPVKPASSEPPAASAPVAAAASAPAPAPEVKATPEVVPAREAPAESSPAVPAPGPVPPGQLVMPGAVTPSQVHAAFRSYAISHVSVLVPAPSLTTGSAFFSPFSAAAQTDGPPPTQEAAHEAKATAPSTPAASPASEVAATLASTPAAEPVPSQAAAPASADEVSARSTSSTAPAPSREGARAAASKPGSTSPSGRSGRTFTTPPPVNSGSRRISRSTPTVQPGGSTGEAGKGSSRSQPAAGMNLEEAQQLAQESAIATAEAALAQVAAKAREPRPKPIELPPNTEFNGELLRRVRESRNLSLSQLAERTRISSKHLENVEADRYTALPATVYLRGILMNIARELGLDPLRVSRSYLALAAEPKKK